MLAVVLTDDRRLKKVLAAQQQFQDTLRAERSTIALLHATGTGKARSTRAGRTHCARGLALVVPPAPVTAIRAHPAGEEFVLEIEWLFAIIGLRQPARARRRPTEVSTYEKAVEAPSAVSPPSESGGA